MTIRNIIKQELKKQKTELFTMKHVFKKADKTESVKGT